jgi:4-amino-4-deoxy-L-arabinose transferase-like glycosyltransferase
MRTLRLVFLPCLVLLSVTLPHLEQGDFRRDTGRYAAVGLHMWSGGSLLKPHLNPETPYFNKPPLAILIHGFFLKTLGPHLAVARLPSILAALGIVALSVLSARQIGSRAEAVVSGLVLALTYEFFRRTREISLDMWQLLFVMLAVFLFLRALRPGSPGGAAWSGLPLGLALLCKPLNALVVLPVFAAWALLGRRPRLLLPLVLAALPVALLVAAPWHLYMHSVFGGVFVTQYFSHEVADRARGLILKEPPGYYLELNAATYWPWLAGLVFAVYRRIRTTAPARSPDRDLVLLGSAWSLLVLVCLSLFPDKKPNYALPLYPMMSWVVAAGLCRLPWRKPRTWYRSSFRGLAPAAVVILIVLSLAPIRFQKPPDRDWQTLLAWLRENRIDTARVYHGALPENDLCYFYLKKGAWLPSVAKLRERPASSPTPLILTRLTDPTAPGTQSRIAFSSGTLTLLTGSAGPPGN